MMTSTALFIGGGIALAALIGYLGYRYRKPKQLSVDISKVKNQVNELKGTDNDNKLP